MANFFPAGSGLDVERTPSLNRRTRSRGVLRESGDDSSSSSDSRQSRPSHVNWLPNSSSSPTTTQQAGPSMPRPPPSIPLARSASLSALAGSPQPLHRQASVISNHSLQLDRKAGSATAAHLTVGQLSPISERSYVQTPTPKREHGFAEVEPTTPASIGSSYSAFLRRPLKRSISATSTSSLRTNVTPTHAPTLPPLNLSPLELRPPYPPVSHRSGQQLVSTVYEDAGSERTGSFVTAHDGEDNSAVSPGAHGPSYSTFLSSPISARRGSRSDPLADLDQTTEGTTTLLDGGGFGGYSGDDSNNTNTNTNSDGSAGDIDIDVVVGSSRGSSGDVPPARPRPRKRTPTSGASGSGSPSEAFIWRRWTRGLSLGSSLSRPSFSAARRAVVSRLPPLPVILFWAGFIAPWCWLIGGWLIEEGRWEDGGRARAALPLWKPRGGSDSSEVKRRRAAGKAVIGAGGDGSQVPPDSFGKDLENGDAAVDPAAATAQEAQAAAGGEGGGEEAAAEGEGEARGRGEEGGPNDAPRRWHWAPARRTKGQGLGPPPRGEKVITLTKPYRAEVWVYRCRLAAVVSFLLLLAALVVALVVIRGSNS